MHSLPVQEARSLKSRCGLGWGPVSSGSSEGEPTACLSPGCWWPPGTLGVPWLAAASSQPLSPSSPGLSLSSPFLSLTRTPVTGFRVTLAQVDLFGKIRCFLIFGYTGPSLLCRDFSRVAGSRAYSLVAGSRASRCSGCSCRRVQALGVQAPVAVGTGFVALQRRIVPDQGLNPCPLHCQADSQPLDHQGSP